MARMHSRKKGKSGSTKPVKEKAPVWIRHETQEVEQLIVKLAKKGESQSRIGIILRDKYGIPDSRKITKKRINTILKENNLKQEIPEDLMNLIKKEIMLLKHTEKNKKDMSAKRGLQLTESKIKRLSKYYKKAGILSEDWKYDREKAKLIVG
jgi:small subunit ribosomal protein S15